MSFKKLRLMPALFITFAVAVSGCATNKPKSAPEPIRNSRPTDYYSPLYLKIARESLPEKSVIFKITPKNWRAKNSTGKMTGFKQIQEGKLYIHLAKNDPASSPKFLLANPESMDPISLGFRKNKISQIAQNKEVFDEIWLAICPGQKATPTIEDCIFSDVAEKVQILGVGGQVSTHPHPGVADIIGFTNYLLPNPKDEALIASTHQAAAKKEFEEMYEKYMAEEREKEKKATAEKNRKIEQEKQKQLKSSKRGDTAYCESTEQIYSGTSITSLRFTCDILRDGQTTVRELENFGWKITNQVRTPVPGTLGRTAYQISLTLVKSR